MLIKTISEEISKRKSFLIFDEPHPHHEELDKGTNRAQAVRGQNVEGTVLALCEVYFIS